MRFRSRHFGHPRVKMSREFARQHVATSRQILAKLRFYCSSRASRTTMMFHAAETAIVARAVGRGDDGVSACSGSPAALAIRAFTGSR